MSTISARWHRSKKTRECEQYDAGGDDCLDEIKPGDRYLSLYGMAWSYETPFQMVLCEACGKRSEQWDPEVRRIREREAAEA